MTAAHGNPSGGPSGKPTGGLTFATVDSEAGLKAALSGSRPDIVMKLRESGLRRMLVGAREHVLASRKH